MLETDGLFGRLYPEDGSYIEEAWKTFEMLHPRNGCYKFASVKKAVSTGDNSFILRPIRMGFFPDVEDDEELQELFRQSMNNGINAVNNLVYEHLSDVPFDFRLEEIVRPFDLLEFLSDGRKAWIDARNGRHSTDPNLMFSAYTTTRAYEMGYRVLMIDTEPKVIESIRNFPLILKWFDSLLAFNGEKNENIDGFSKSWETRANVRVYGNERSMRARVKTLNSNGEVKYSSLLMKMYLKQAFFDDINDYTGVELVVEDDNARRRIISLFKSDAKPTIKLEDFSDRTKRKTDPNPHSAIDFGNVSFKVRAAVPIGYPGMEGRYERLPVEVQVLTLEEDRVRREHPNVSHDYYKRKQFMKVFPVLFPREIYEPLIRERYRG